MSVKDDEKPKIRIVKFMPVALWSLKTKMENCAICRNHIMDSCIECNTSMVENCTIAWGKCNHAFHAHCIKEWLKNKSICPLDTQKWEYKEE
ncbi:putative ring-box protein [Pseudoloma neurophilia]|uniref:Putative ring-box protein n=1 Tax=Pseudoloma neurophilia TaxID=146866 RepID=A0A0R0M2E8_9MICR|nr:putative ring-box protein [Pseudoloma neurophilia]